MKYLIVLTLVFAFVGCMPESKEELKKELKKELTEVEQFVQDLIEGTQKNEIIWGTAEVLRAEDEKPELFFVSTLKKENAHICIGLYSKKISICMNFATTPEGDSNFLVLGSSEIKSSDLFSEIIDQLDIRKEKSLEKKRQRFVEEWNALDAQMKGSK